VNGSPNDVLTGIHTTWSGCSAGSEIGLSMNTLQNTSKFSHREDDRTIHVLCHLLDDVLL
jgi:hypothetical protein